MAQLIEFSFESRLALMDAAALVRLARHAWRSNTARGLTGEMRFAESRVAQVAEGDIDVMLPLAARILSDPRHSDIRVLSFGTIDERRFEGWRVHGLPAIPVEAAPLAADVVSLVVALESESARPRLRLQA
jgi:hypothetical protein